MNALRLLLLLSCFGPVTAAPKETSVEVDASRPQQALDGMGCGLIFYEAHATSLGGAGKPQEQEALYDAMFRDVPTRYLHLMIRHDHEPENDNADPFTPAFKPDWFEYCKATVAVCKAALARRPDMEFYATLYTPPVWMKTNNDPSAGGQARATLKPGMELELAEFLWAFLDHMRSHGVTVGYLSLANEPDWPHTQPGYCLTPEQNAELTLKCGRYFEEMARRHPQTPRPRLVCPNVLSAVGCAEKWLPPLLRKAGKYVDIVGSHDYDRRGDRWRTLVRAADKRPVWGTEWCVNGPDDSPHLLRSAGEFWLAMSEAFNGGANAWMAYDWVYPPRQGGEALIHLDWGKSWTATKIYHGFRQWCGPLKPGMKVVPTRLKGPAASDISKPGLKACAFLTPDGKRLVVHLAAVQDAPVPVALKIPRPFERASLRRWHTTSDHDCAEVPAGPSPGPEFHESLPGRGLLTLEFSLP